MTGTARCGDADDLLRRTLAVRPDVVVTDVQMPPDRTDDGLRAAAAGGTALDPEVVARMLGHRRRGDPLQVLTPRERAVLAAMAEGKSNLGISRSLLTSLPSVEKHVTAIFRKLGLAPADTDHRRVQAVLTYLRHHHRR